MAKDWAEERERGILDSVYYCETCNMIIEIGDEDVQRHKTELPHHKMRRVLSLRCGRCGNVVTDSNAQYSPEKNQFWCKNCVSDAGVHAFHSA
jgi:formylmethanofuran dehydrogenase subunit E